MPAMNMEGTVASNPSLGKGVLMNPFSGPKGSPLDKDSTGQYSTGALNTGIGFGPATKVAGGGIDEIKPDFNDNYTPGVTMPDGTTAATEAVLTAIGGGKSDENGVSVPYAAQPLLAFGNGGSRDAGAGPAFTGFGTKLVTATGAVANGSAIETGFTNRSGVTMAAGQSQFGSSTTASPAVT